MLNLHINKCLLETRFLVVELDRDGAAQLYDVLKEAIPASESPVATDLRPLMDACKEYIDSKDTPIGILPRND